MSFTSGDERWSDVYLLAITRGVSVCGDFLAATTLALVLQQAGHGGLAVSGLMVAASLPLALVAPLGGRIADRADSRVVLVAAGLLQGLICLALAFVHQPVAIIGLVTLLACGLAVTQPTIAALVPRMVRPENLARASGLNQTAGVIGMLIAPALAGFLVGQTGSRLPLLLDAATYLALVVAGFAIRTRRTPAAATEVAQNVRYRIWDDRTLTVMVVALAAVVAGVSAVNVVDVFFIRDTLAASTTVFGLVAAAWPVGMLIGSLAFGRVPRHRITVPALLLVVAGSCAPLLGSIVIDNALWLVPLWILGGIGNGGINVFVMVIVAGRAPSVAHGRAFAMVSAAVQGASLIGLLAAGPLVEHFEPRWVLAAAGGLGLVAALVALPLVGRTEEEPAHEARLGEMPTNEARTGETRTGETRTGETRTGETRTGETRTGETRTGETRTGETQAIDAPAGDGRAHERREAESRAPEARAHEVGARDVGAREAALVEGELVVAEAAKRTICGPKHMVDAM
ncbi:MFS transporter [Actinoplanes sp. CA-142083]|uniref:MFS transporter n=1 Tax=Actinoplanes sp. CA-142083 TaxID=3239903 RepID=UPI003D93AF26